MNKSMDEDLKRKLWASAEAMRGNISSEQYMLIVIGIMFLKSMSDKYDVAINELKNRKKDTWQHFIDDKDTLAGKYDCSFIIPKKASWKYIEQYASTLEIGSIIDNAFMLIEDANDELKGLFDKNYNREELDQRKLGQVVSIFSNLDMESYGEDVIGRTYEFFLGNFFKKQGQKGGEFYTPKSLVSLMVNLIQPHYGKIFDPACGTGGMFIQARQRLIENKEDPKKLIIYGQEYQNKTWKLAKINLLLNGFNSGDIHLGTKAADSFMNDQHKGEKFDYVLANPPFNQKKWGLEELMHDERWNLWGIPPSGNANYAWLSHMVSKLTKNGKAATILANGSLSTSSKQELAMRKKMTENNQLDMIIALPDKLFYTTGIPAAIWVFNNNKLNKNVLMIDASDFDGEMLSKKLRELTNKDISKITKIYSEHLKGKKVEEVGFAKTINKEELIENDYSFVPGRYVGFIEEEINREEIKEEIKKSSSELRQLLSEFNKLIPDVDKAIEKALEFNEE